MEFIIFSTVFKFSITITFQRWIFNFLPNKRVILAAFHPIFFRKIYNNTALRSTFNIAFSEGFFKLNSAANRLKENIRIYAHLYGEVT